MTLQRLIVTFKSEELIVHALYRSDGISNPGTKARTREVSELARSGLRDAWRPWRDVWMWSVHLGTRSAKTSYVPPGRRLLAYIRSWRGGHSVSIPNLVSGVLQYTTGASLPSLANGPDRRPGPRRKGMCELH